MRSLRSSLHFLLGLAVGIGILGSVGTVQAAEKVVLKYGPIRESVSVAELSAFAKTGELSPALQSYMKLSKANPNQVRKSLTQEVKIDHVLLDRILNSPVGNLALDKVGEAIQTPAGSANRQALRGALSLSASDNNKISLLEVIEKYPTQEVHVRVDRLASAYNQLAKLTKGVRGIFGQLIQLLGKG